MKLFGVLALFAAFATPLTRMNHAVTSLNQLSRRSRVGEDKLRRTLRGLGEEVNDPLIRLEGRCYILTPAGRELLTVVERLLAVAKGRPVAEDSIELMSIAVAESLPPQLLALLTAEFLRSWQGLVRLRFDALDLETIRERIASGIISFGIGWEQDSADTAVVKIEPGLTWSILVSLDHPLAKRGEPATADDLAEWPIFLPPLAARSAHLSGFLSSIHPANRVEVDSLATARTLVETGAGVAFDLDFGAEGCQSSYVRLPVAGVEREWLVIYLPRNTSDISEPARFMIDAIKRAMAEPRNPAQTQETPFVTPTELGEQLPA